MNKNVYFFIGTTAEYIKLSPVIKELKKRKIPFKVITSGQNEILFRESENFTGKIANIISIGKKDNKSSIIRFALWAAQTYFACLFSLNKEFKDKNKKNTYVIVHGDTVSSLLGALVAKWYRLTIVHIESGLRSFNFTEPFPEEICRYIVSSMSDIHFCPNAWAVKNLKNKSGEKINTFQNTLIEAFWAAVASPKGVIVPIPKNKKYFILVIHRQEHVIFKKNETKEMLEFILQHMPENLQCIFIMHELTASFMQAINSNVGSKSNIIMVPRMPYNDFAKLMQHSEFMITDGGSNQEEAYYLGKACLILRNCTERIEGLGGNAVLNKKNYTIMKSFLQNYSQYKRNPVKKYKNPSKIIVDYLLKREL